MKITIEIAKASLPKSYLALENKPNSWSDHKIITKSLMQKIANNILERFDNFKIVEEFELSILLANDKKLKDLNSQFRNKDKTTNVLSFPDITLNWQDLVEFKPDPYYMYLGDMAFSYQTLKQEAIEQGKSFEHHFIHLFVHSMLHLLGFDHQNEFDAKAMEELEIIILKDFAIASPYEYK